MLSQLFFANLHFIINVFSAFVFFTTGWLHLDSWKIAKQTKSELVRSLGFFLLAAAAIVQATALTLPVLNFSVQAAKIVASLLILSSLAVEPILTAPKKKPVVVVFPFMLLTNSLVPLSAILFLLIALLYLRQSTEGKAKQIKPAALAFGFLALAELINIAFFAANTPVVAWSKLLAPYGLFWQAAHLLQLLGIIILALWTWSYLRFKADLQFFITLVSFSLLIFVTTTAAFTFLLLKNLEANTLAQLKTDVGVMQYALERLELEALADARAVAQNSQLQNAFLQPQSDQLFKLTSELMFSQQTSFLTVASASGQVVMRAEDRDHIGDSLFTNPLFISAINNLPLVTVEAKPGILAPKIQVLAADSFPHQTGVVITGFNLDNAFVDGVKTTTGLDTSVYSQATRVATTFIAPDGKSRFIGTQETDPQILSTVLDQGQIYTGPAKILNQPFHTAYAPLKNAQDQTIGMLFVGKPQTELFTAAQKSIQLTFTVSAFFILLSVIPAYYLSRYIKDNLKA